MSDAAAAVGWLLKQAEPEARRLAAQQIVKVPGPMACKLLLTALADEDWRVRKEATLSAAAMEPREAVIGCLISALDEKVNVGLRNGAVEALTNIGPAAVPATVQALSTLDADGRKLAVEILGGIPDERGVAALTASLRDDDPNVRSASAEALGSADRAGEDARKLAISALTALLGSQEMFLKLAALDALTRLGADLPWSTFAPFSGDGVLRRYVIAAAARSDEPAALDALAQAVMDPARTVAREAVLALGERLFGALPDAPFKRAMDQRLRATTGARDRIRPLVQQHDDPRARAAGILVLGLFADTADLPLFVEALTDTDMIQHAEQALACFGVEAVGPLLSAARGELPGVRASVLSIVPTMNPEAGANTPPELEETLNSALSDPSPEVVAAALRLLASGGRASDLARVAPFASHPDARVAAAAVSTLSALAGRHKVDARRALEEMGAGSTEAPIVCVVIGALARVGATQEDDLTTLDMALAHGDARTRRAAIDALAALGGDAAGDAVAFALADEERDVQLAAVRALGVLGRTEILLAQIAADRDPGLVAAALRALSADEPDATFEAARGLLLSRDPAIASAAVEAIGRLAAPHHREVLFDALAHEDPEVVKIALSEVGGQVDGLTLSHLARCLDHRSWEVRRLACELLGGHGRKDGVAALLHARLERERDPMVREAISQALSMRSA